MKKNLLSLLLATVTLACRATSPCTDLYTTTAQWEQIMDYEWFHDDSKAERVYYYIKPRTDEVCMSDPVYGHNRILVTPDPFAKPLYEGDIVIPPVVTYTDVTYAVTEVNSFYDSVVTSVTVPEGVTRVEGFINCARLSSVSLPQSVTEIAGFIGCPALLELTIPAGVRRIAEQSVSNCPALWKVCLETVPEDGELDFTGCPAIRYIECMSPIPLAIGKDAFRDIDRSKCTVVVPEGSVETYRADPEWGQFRIVGSGSGVGEVADAGGLPVEVEAVAGGIRVTGGTPAAVRVIGIDGTVAAALTVCGGQTVALPAGVYVVAAGGHARKVAVR